MAQQPAVIIIARHGPRLDAADQEWHLSTPTPYDPPLTFGGWNQCRALGVRIASLLYAREQSINGPPTATHEPPTPSGVFTRDFAGTTLGDGEGQTHRKSKRRRHKVVIHTSPFLRCIETSVAIAAGIAQFVPATQSTPGGGVNKAAGAGRGRTPNQLYSMSPRTSGSDYGPLPALLPVPEPRHGFGQELARRVAQEQRRHRKSKLRVDAFLGEWLNPEYFEHITPPPPSALMLTTAKAELMHNETIDVFTPTITTKSSHSSLWAGASAGTRPHSRDSALDDWDDFQDALVPPSPRRDRTNSHSSVGSTDSNASRRYNNRNIHGPQSTFANSDTVAYAPPVPTYAVSTSSNIPKGYVAHARHNCTNVDYQWDSSRAPQDWGDGGEYGEEWSLMHRRFRRGLTSLVYWYSQHNADDRGEDALGIDQAEHNEDHDADVQEDLVIVLVTHGAGCNALIGALTGQPVLMDVGMASLTMAVRKDDAPPASILIGESQQAAQTYESMYRPRQGSLDIGLTAMYDMKIVASSEHLRPGYDPLKFAASGGQRTIDPISRLRPFRGDSLGHSAMTAPWSPTEEQPGRNSMSAALGSIRRPTSSYFPPAPTSAPSSKSNSLTPSDARDTLSTPDSGITTPSSWTGGLWTPPEARTPQLAAHYIKDERREVLASLNEASFRHTLMSDVMNSDRFAKSEEQLPQHKTWTPQLPAPHVHIIGEDTKTVAPSTTRTTGTDQVTQLQKLLDEQPPQALSRGMSQRALWKSKPTGDAPKREFKEGPKRRWTLTDEQQQQLHQSK